MTCVSAAAAHDRTVAGDRRGFPGAHRRPGCLASLSPSGFGPGRRLRAERTWRLSPALGSPSAMMGRHSPFARTVRAVAPARSESPRPACCRSKWAALHQIRFDVSHRRCAGNQRLGLTVRSARGYGQAADSERRHGHSFGRQQPPSQPDARRAGVFGLRRPLRHRRQYPEWARNPRNEPPERAATATKDVPGRIICKIAFRADSHQFCAYTSRRYPNGQSARVLR